MTYIVKPLWEIMVPYVMGDHDGTNPDLPKRNRNIPVPYHQEWDEFVRNVTGGLTIHRAARGQWEDRDGKLYKEIMIPRKSRNLQFSITSRRQFSLPLLAKRL
jgi:hypothetical protein